MSSRSHSQPLPWQHAQRLDDEKSSMVLKDRFMARSTADRNALLAYVMSL